LFGWVDVAMESIRIRKGTHKIRKGESWNRNEEKGGRIDGELLSTLLHAKYLHMYRPG
jgi:hypothetical protein